MVQPLTNALADYIRIVGDLEVRQMLADFLGHLLGREAHGCNVVGPQRQLALWRLHELHRCAVAVGDVHHGEARFGTQVTLVVARAESIVEDLNCIICGDKGVKCSYWAGCAGSCGVKNRCSTCGSSSGSCVDRYNTGVT